MLVYCTPLASDDVCLWDSSQHLLMGMPQGCVTLYVTVFMDASLSGEGEPAWGESGMHGVAAHKPPSSYCQHSWFSNTSLHIPGLENRGADVQGRSPAR